MFTGIVESLARVRAVETRGSNRTFWIESPLATEFKIDQSIAHNGVCLTVEEIQGEAYRVTAVEETLRKTNLGHWGPGTAVNLERSMLPTTRVDGHFVQGHVDTTGTLISKKDLNGSWELRFSFPPAFAALVIEKGSICVNGVSLTAFQVTGDSFTVAIIPYTWTHTNLQFVAEGEAINLEFDLLGKYILRKLSLETSAAAS